MQENMFDIEDVQPYPEDEDGYERWLNEKEDIQDGLIKPHPQRWAWDIIPERNVAL
jgi:hypothetical protein